MANGASGVTVGATGGYIGTILNAVEKDNPTYDLTGFGPLVAKEGDVAYSGYYSNALTGDTLFMTSQCKNKEAAVKFMNSLSLFVNAVHVATVHSCVLHPASATHRQLTDKQLEEAGVRSDLIRLSVGIEDAEDIIADIEQALALI